MDILSTIGSLFGTFGVNWAGLIGQLVTFVILLVGLRAILYKPVLNMLEERKQRIAQGLKDAEAAASAKERSELEAAQQLREATEKAQELLEEAQKSSQRLKDQLMAQTQAEIDRTKRDQAAQMEQMRSDMLRDVRAEVAELVVTTTKKVLGGELSPADQKQIAAKAAKEMK
jgi:F-type H+-transporting ATPase subunit b